MAFRRILAICAAVMMLTSAAVGASLKDQTKDLETEKNLGKQGADDAAKSLKFVADPAINKRIEAIGQKLATIAKTNVVKASYGQEWLANFDYSFKVVDDKTVNAFSLPAGYIYVNKGLIDRVESDDELAGVIAHEIGHVSHHHMLRLIKKKSQLDSSMLLIIAAAALGKANTGDLSNIYYGAQLLQMAQLNSYSQEAEYDADTSAIDYMIKAGYNPVGMLTVLEGLAREEAYSPSNVANTIYQDHPLSRARAKNIIAVLNKKGIPIDRYSVETGTLANVREVTVKSKKLSEVYVGDKTIFRPADQPGQPSADRAKAIAATLNKLLRQSPGQWEVRLSPDGTGVYLRQTLVVDIAQADADLAGATPQKLADSTKQSIQAAILAEQMRQMY